MQVKSVLAAALDKSSLHNQVQLGKEFAQGVLPCDAPFERARTIVYADSISQVVVTDHVVVACCRFMESVLM